MKNILKSTALAFAALTGSAITAGAAEMLTAPVEMTLYIFDKDTGSTSVCYDDCAVKWPPFLGKEGDPMEADWALSPRTDGTMQWTYDGKPLYFYFEDTKAGDMTGDGLGGVWHIVMEE